jgi:hypothetical protein
MSGEAPVDQITRPLLYYAFRAAHLLYAFDLSVRPNRPFMPVRASASIAIAA